MKKTILLGSMAMVALSAAAQYSCDPTTEALLKNGTPSKVWYITLSESSVAELEKAGVKVDYVGPDGEAGRNFWYWAGWVAGPETNPRVGLEDGGYVSITVTGDAGWSGGGFAINGPLSKDDKGNPTPGAGVDLSEMSDDTHFHFAYMTNGNAPTSVAMIILDDSANGSNPAKVAIGKEAFNDNGAIFPQIGGEFTDEWQGVDIKFSALKKLWPTFDFSKANMKQWGGNILSMLSGNVAQTNFCLDAIYFYNEKTSGVEGVASEEALIVVTPNTVNASGANGIQVWNAAGQLVASTNGSVLGIENLASGVYFAKAGNTVKKFVK